jgi:hypothetical protein
MTAAGRAAVEVAATARTVSRPPGMIGKRVTIFCSAGRQLNLCLIDDGSLLSDVDGTSQFK